MIGAAQAAHALTVEYARTRRQFGELIGKFQGVKHPLAEMYVELETARSLVYYASWALSASRAEVPRTASMAKACASDAFARIGVDAIQLHGAIGVTREHPLHLATRRLWSWRDELGGDRHWARLLGERLAPLGPDGVWNWVTQDLDVADHGTP